MLRGTVYSIDAESSKDLPDEVAQHWKTTVHQFIVIEPITEVSLKTKTDVVSKEAAAETEGSEEVVAEEKEEVEVAAPAKTTIIKKPKK